MYGGSDDPTPCCSRRQTHRVGLTEAQRALGRWTRSIKSILKQGVESGEFAPGSVRFVPPVIETLSWHMVQSSSATGKTVDDGVRFVLAAVLAPTVDTSS